MYDMKFSAKITWVGLVVIALFIVGVVRVDSLPRNLDARGAVHLTVTAK